MHTWGNDRRNVTTPRQHAMQHVQSMCTISHVPTSIQATQIASRAHVIGSRMAQCLICPATYPAQEPECAPGVEGWWGGVGPQRQPRTTLTCCVATRAPGHWLLCSSSAASHAHTGDEDLQPGPFTNSLRTAVLQQLRGAVVQWCLTAARPQALWCCINVSLLLINGVASGLHSPPPAQSPCPCQTLQGTRACQLACTTNVPAAVVSCDWQSQLHTSSLLAPSICSTLPHSPALLPRSSTAINKAHRQQPLLLCLLYRATSTPRCCQKQSTVHCVCSSRYRSSTCCAAAP